MDMQKNRFQFGMVRCFGDGTNFSAQPPVQKSWTFSGSIIKYFKLFQISYPRDLVQVVVLRSGCLFLQVRDPSKPVLCVYGSTLRVWYMTQSTQWLVVDYDSQVG